jgi:signal recognition particle subunit SRP54
MEDLLKMIPGMANNPALKNFKMDPKDVAHMKAIVMSMTEQERVEPDVLNPSRRRRIAAGSGRPVLEVNRLIKQFNASKKMMNQMTKGNMSGMEQMMGGGVKGRLGKMAMNRMMKQQKKNKKKRLKNAKRFKS